MKRMYLWVLYLTIFLSSSILLWFMYIGPFTTYKVKRQIVAQKQSIIISLTTTPYRIQKIKDTLDSILAQSIKADEIYLNIPYTFKRDNIEYIVPEWLNNYSGIIINRSEDFGPLTKLMPALQQDLPSDTIIITLDDDLWYPKQVVRDLVNYSMQHPKSAVTLRNFRLHLTSNPKFDHVTEHYRHAAQAPIVIGSTGVAYRRNFFDQEFITMLSELPTVCKLADDLVISMYLAQKNILIEQSIAASLNPLIAQHTFKNQSYMNQAGALSYGAGDMLGNQKNYRKCLTDLAGNKYQQAFMHRSASLDQDSETRGFWDVMVALLEKIKSDIS